MSDFEQGIYDKNIYIYIYTVTPILPPCRNRVIMHTPNRLCIPGGPGAPSNAVPKGFT